MTSHARNRFILDASVAIKWYLKDEPYVAEADALLTSFGEGSIALVSPQHIHYEVTNALRTAVRRGRLAEDEARLSVDKFLDLELPTVRGNNLILRGWDASHKYGCALYDGLYAGLAEMIGVPLVHADRRLHNTLNGRFDLEIWIEDLPIF